MPQNLNSTPLLPWPFSIFKYLKINVIVQSMTGINANHVHIRMVKCNEYPKNYFCDILKQEEILRDISTQGKLNLPLVIQNCVA